MFFASKQKLEQMTDAALDSRKGTLDTVKKLGEGLAKGSVGGGVLFGIIALLANASKFAVAVAFGAGAAVPVVAGIATVIFAAVELGRVEKVQASRPRAVPAKKQTAKDAAPAAAPALANAPDLGEDFHAGVKEGVAAMKPLKFKTRPQSPGVMP